MKTTTHRFGNLLGVLALMTAPVLTGQDNAPHPGPPPPPREERPEMMPQDRRMNRMREQIDSLHRMGKHDAAMQLERRIQGATGGAPLMMPPQGGRVERKAKAERREEGKPGEPIPLKVKIQHLKRAAESLKAAGYMEYAEKARQEIGRLEEQMRREAGPNTARMRDEMAKMRKEMEELRQQIRRLKAEAAPKHEAPPAQP